MPRKPISLFLLGATGYIGGSVLNRLLALNADASQPHVFEITALVRDKEKARLLAQLENVTPLEGSLNDAEKLEDISSRVDVIMHTAHADHMPAIKAILAGMSKATVPPILIHTSGTGVLIMIKDHPGESPPPEYKIYNDMDIAHIESLAPTQPHRDVDLEIVAAAEKFRLKTHIVLPCTIYGIASGPVFSRGIANPHSIQTPNLIRAALDRKKAGTVGQGLNHWPNVHVDDCADGFIVILEKALEGKTATGREGYYFLENGEYIFRDVAAEIGRVLKCLGKAETDEVTPFSDEEVQKYFGSPYLGSNSRCRAERARALGWTPKKTTEDYIASIRPEIEALIVRDQGKGFVARPDGVVAQEEARK